MPRTPGPLNAIEVRDAAERLRTGEPLERTVLARVVRAVCAELARLHPGGSIELRVPPFAAVQLALDDAGRHRRGTPPNVVECSPEVLLRLAAGTLTWADAKKSHHVLASGTRSDLRAIFPLVSG
ncbi:sterol carrier family protein [Micropruina sp.]|uniref:sterol carrier family protein n=1 Tax=Micropruina sp. TaxID=2737536 RepID=UPI0039E69395